MNARPASISVIIPTCNRPALVAEAIESVLCQQATELEVIVVDDGPAEDTAGVVRAFGPPVRYLSQQNRGPAAARNCGMRVASGAFLAFLDDDDLWSHDKLAVQLPVLVDRAGTDMVLGHTQRMVLRETAPGEQGFVNYRDPVRLHSLGCGLFRRAVFERVGLLDEKLRHAEDDDWFMRARSLGISMEFLPDVTLFYRFHGANMSTDRQGKLPDMLRLVKNRLDRMRDGQEDA